jgi:hypothetical protein
MELLTNSRVECFNECPRKHQLKYVECLRLVAEDDVALTSGTAYHWLQEQWRTSQMRGKEVIPSLDAAALVQGSTMDPFEHAKVSAMFTAYVERYRRDPLSFLAVESEWKAPLVHPVTGEVSDHWRIGGKLDGIAFREDPTQPVIVEYKTSKEDVSVGSPYWERKRLDRQVSMYHRGAAVLGFPVVGCAYDAARKPGIKPKQVNKTNKVAETPGEFGARCLSAIADDIDSYFVRQDIVRTEKELAEASLDVWETAEVMRLSRENGLAPRNTSACFKWGKPCVYWNHCTGDRPIHEDSRFKKFDNQHPELGEEKAA